MTSYSFPQVTVLWNATMETGDITQWNGQGGSFPSGSCTEAASTTVAHGGTYSLKSEVPSGSGGANACRMFRWGESQNSTYYGAGLYYSAWVYIPQAYVVTGSFFNFWQIKSVVYGSGTSAPCGGGQVKNDPLWTLDLANRTPHSASNMFFRLIFNPSGTYMTGPYETSNNSLHLFTQATADIPLATWFFLEIYVKQWPHDVAGYGGRITVYQNNVNIIDLGYPGDPLGGITTKYGDDTDNTKICHGADQISWNVYTDTTTPTPVNHYLDDLKTATGSTFPIQTPGGTTLGKVELTGKATLQ